MTRKDKKNKQTILVVEDDEFICETLSEMLSDDGYKVTRANDGKEAWAIFDKEHFDLVLTDIMMPHMNGFDLLQEIRKRGSTVGVIFVTAFGGVESHLQAMSLGATEYLNKPFEINELKKLIRNVLSRPIEDESERLKKQNKYLLERIKYLENKLNKLTVNTQSEQAIDKYRAIVGATGHSLNTELMNIAGTIMLLRRLDDRSPEDRYDLIERSVQYSLLLLRKLLDFLDMGKPYIEQIDVAKLIQKIVTLVKPRLSTNIQLKVTVLHDEGGYSINANNEQLMEVLVELVQNASTALRINGGAIELRLEKRGNEIALSVIDNGPGIPEELRSELFVKEVKSKHGLGLGLHLSSKIINALGGELMVENTSKKGTVITLLLPSVINKKE